LISWWLAFRNFWINFLNFSHFSLKAKSLKIKKQMILIYVVIALVLEISLIVPITSSNIRFSLKTRIDGTCLTNNDDGSLLRKLCVHKSYRQFWHHFEGRNMIESLYDKRCIDVNEKSKELFLNECNSTKLSQKFDFIFSGNFDQMIKNKQYGECIYVDPDTNYTKLESCDEELMNMKWEYTSLINQ
jgi:hypothetical protein